MTSRDQLYPNTSRILADAGLVRARQVGRLRLYELDPQGIAELKQAIDAFWNRELDELASLHITERGRRTMSAEKSVVVPLTPEETFSLITEPDRIRRWKAVSARIDLRAGGEYRFTVTPGHIAAGVVEEVEAGKRLVLSWGWEGDRELPPGASTVTITLEPTTGGTLVRLVHEGLTEEQAKNHGVGWEHYLDRLKIQPRPAMREATPGSPCPIHLTDLAPLSQHLRAAKSCCAQLAPIRSHYRRPVQTSTWLSSLTICSGSLANLANVAGAGGAPVQGDIEDE